MKGLHDGELELMAGLVAGKALRAGEWLYNEVAGVRGRVGEPTRLIERWI